MRRKKRKKRPSCLHVEVALDEDKPDLAIGLKPTRQLPIGLDVCRVQDGLHPRVHRPPASSQPMASASWGLRVASHPTWGGKLEVEREREECVARKKET